MKLNEKAMKIVFFIAAFLSVVAVITICVFLAISGGAAMREIGVQDFLFGDRWQPLSGKFGIFPMVVGTIYTTIGAMVVGVPIGIACAIYLAFFCPKKIYKIMKPAVDLMVAIPSIVYGFFGLMLLVPFIGTLTDGNGKGILTASILLGIMILPTIIGITETSLKQVPKTYYEGALALGSSHELSVVKVVVPAAKSGIVAGIILGVGRAIGEAMAVVLVAGNQPVVPDSILGGVRTLTTNVVLEMGYAQDLHRGALIATAFVLFVLVFFINLLFSLMRRRGVES